jgi:hypothetical protein
MDDVNTSAEPSPEQLWYEAPLAARMKSHPYRVMLGVCAIAFLLGCLTGLGARPKGDSDIIKRRPVPVWKAYWIFVAISFAGVLALFGLAVASGGLAVIIPYAAGYYAMILLLPVGCLLLGISVSKAVRGRNPPRTAGISRPIC